MKIEESNTVLSGSHHLESESSLEVSTRLSFRTVFADVSAASGATESTAPGNGTDRLRLMLEQLIATLLALISGGKNTPKVAVHEISATADGKEAPRPLKAFAWQSEYTETIKEHERSDFSASGSIKTADGRSIDFNLDLAMCRDFQCERRQVDSGKVVMRDPLVINFAGKAAELGAARFDFDLDADGRNESLHGLSGGSGFLALDLNGDGRINDGRELFGAQSGDGFADLARLDSDGNHWLDEADSAFAALRVWLPQGAQAGELVSLKDKGVGALYLGSSATPFALKDETNRSRGEIRASGIYLREDGGAGTLQQVDLAV